MNLHRRCDSLAASHLTRAISAEEALTYERAAHRETLQALVAMSRQMADLKREGFAQPVPVISPRPVASESLPADVERAVLDWPDEARTQLRARARTLLEADVSEKDTAARIRSGREVEV